MRGWMPFCGLYRAQLALAMPLVERITGYKTYPRWCVRERLHWSCQVILKDAGCCLKNGQLLNVSRARSRRGFGKVWHEVDETNLKMLSFTKEMTTD